MKATAATEQMSGRSRRLLQAGGTLNPKKHIYIQRPEDDEVLKLLLAGEYVNVLTSRQMGKSSLMARTAYALQERGVRFVSIDLAGELGSGDDPVLYYQALLQKIARSLELPIDLKTWWQRHELETNNQKLLRFFKEEVGEAIDAPVVVFLDEIDSTLKLPFTDDLFTALRTMNNERTFEEAYQRLTFCLLGVATPNELIKDRRTTPYNVGRTLELRDFDAERDDLSLLAQALSLDLEAGKTLLGRVLHWTGGHPYLTNRLCHDLAEAGVQSTDQVNHLVDDTFRTLERVGSDVHFQQILRFVEERFTKEQESLDLYARILKGVRERDQPSLAHTELKLSGLVKRDDEGCLIVRNPIYARLFDRDWVKSTRPKRTLARTRRLAIAASIAVGLLAGGGILYQVLVVSPQQHDLALRQQLEELQIGLVQSDRGDGLRVEFPKEADQALLEKAVPLLLALPEEVIELDLQAEDFRGNTVEVTDLTPIADLSALRWLDLGDTQVADISQIKGLSALQTLFLSYTQVTDISPIKGLSDLQWLNLSNTQVTDISPIKGLSNLQRLDLDSTRIGSINALKELADLLWLDLRNTQVADISSLKGLSDLRWLNLSNTQVNDISVLKELADLQSLYLNNTQIADISALKGLADLQSLYLNNTQIADISALKGLADLQRLYLNNTQVTDISALKGLADLQSLNLSNTQVTDIRPLKGLSALQRLYLNNTQVTDISALKGLADLQSLNLSNTQVTDISALKELAALLWLDLNNTQITDISALKGLADLQSLNLSNTQVPDEAFAAFKQDLAARGIAIDRLTGPDGSSN